MSEIARGILDSATPVTDLPLALFSTASGVAAPRALQSNEVFAITDILIFSTQGATFTLNLGPSRVGQQILANRVVRFRCGQCGGLAHAFATPIVGDPGCVPTITSDGLYNDATVCGYITTVRSPV